MKVAVFDVCGTIYDENTTFAFLDSYFSDNRKYKFFRKLSKSFIWKVANYPFYRFLHTDITRIIALSFLKGESLSDIDRSAQEFVLVYLPSKVKKNITSLYNYYRDQGFDMVLMSGSLDVLIRHVGLSFMANNTFATELEAKNGVYTGKVSKDQLFNKAEVLQVNYPDLKYLVVVSDNKTDLSLFLLADKAYAVCKKNKQSKYWHSKKISHLEILK